MSCPNLAHSKAFSLPVCLLLFSHSLPYSALCFLMQDLYLPLKLGIYCTKDDVVKLDIYTRIATQMRIGYIPIFEGVNMRILPQNTHTGVRCLARVSQNGRTDGETVCTCFPYEASLGRLITDGTMASLNRPCRIYCHLGPAKPLAAQTPT